MMIIHENETNDSRGQVKADRRKYGDSVWGKGGKIEQLTISQGGGKCETTFLTFSKLSDGVAEQYDLVVMRLPSRRG
jgi:hypothetical protein